MSAMIDAAVAALYRYPVKGLSAEALPHAILSPGKTVPGDRSYAIENGPTGFDPAAPRYFPKSRFLMLMRDERLAALRSRYDDASRTLTIHANGEEAVRADLGTAEGRATVERFFAANFTQELKGPPQVLVGNGHSFSDVARKVVSIINLGSVAAIETMVGQPVHPLRFRANLYIRGWPAWSELDLLERTLAIGDIRLKVVKRIVRCTATNVDPEAAVRDLDIPRTLMRTLGHCDCGVYAEVVTGGTIRIDDKVETLGETLA
ncbi:MOSC domain-containing protein [Nitrobacter sp. NHB1]|uniref:MOSC domain-containing protein n=1 Tax=Nitrobacter sp. NHB1 TaxID=3119830 RepID=UPI002FFDFCA5